MGGNQAALIADKTSDAGPVRSAFFLLHVKPISGLAPDTAAWIPVAGGDWYRGRIDARLPFWSPTSSSTGRSGILVEQSPRYGLIR